MSSEADIEVEPDSLSSFTDWLAQLQGGAGAALMTRMGAADQTAFGEFYDLTAPRVLAIVRAVVIDPELSEELTGEIFLEFWKTAPLHAREFEPLRSVALFAHYRAEQRRTLLDGRR
ncbi:hypothetical protein [Subtercola sp. YIM 133946]|uniref:hypothetical protein n=1 Tax=Subtercola sp. YIM 133946 TaxID=3118909 RepID=UPI002F93455C